MSPIGILFLCAGAAGLAVLPRRWAAVPLVAGACYMTVGQEITVGPFTFTVIRILILVGLVRVRLRRERLAGGLHALDWSILAWGAWACFSALFHAPVLAALVFRLGLVYNAWGIYFLTRIFCSSVDDGLRLARATVILLALVASEMVYEHFATHNLFSPLGAVNMVPEMREGRYRASGPFEHPILAGTVGAVSLPLVIGWWRYGRIAACFGALVCLAMIVTSASSGPIVAMLWGVAAVFMWRFRHRTRSIRWLAVGAYLVLELVMKAPAYYLIARVDVVGGSTGWYRARLIQSALEHVGEWWLAGTDQTRHWMQTGVGDQADIVNHYLQTGVWGGLPLVLLLIAVLWAAFARVGAAIRDDSALTPPQRFVVWTLGASLAAHAVTWLGVSYFDQIVVFLYVTLAAIGSALPMPAEALSDGGKARALCLGASSAKRRVPPGRWVLPGDPRLKPSRPERPAATSQARRPYAGQRA
jgi:hypothetical protein